MPAALCSTEHPARSRVKVAPRRRSACTVRAERWRAARRSAVVPAAAPVASPCLIDGRSRAPVSCECLRACESLGVMGNRACYVMNAANESLMRWVRRRAREERGGEGDSIFA